MYFVVGTYDWILDLSISYYLHDRIGIQTASAILLTFYHSMSGFYDISRLKTNN